MDCPARRAALYARTSTSDQHAELQLHDLRQLAEQRGWRVVGEYVDEGISGARERRPQLDRLMQDAHAGKLDVVAVWRFDRFARSVKHLVTALDTFRAIGVDFVSARDAVDTTTPAGRFTFQVFAAVAELERELIRERTRAGVAAARRRGKRIGRPPCRLDIDHALELRAQGHSVRQIAAELGAPRSVIQRALKAPSDGVCAVCRAPVQLDLHGRARWHSAPRDGAICPGTGAG